MDWQQFVKNPATIAALTIKARQTRFTQFSPEQCATIIQMLEGRFGAEGVLLRRKDLRSAMPALEGVIRALQYRASQQYGARATGYLDTQHQQALADAWAVVDAASHHHEANISEMACALRDAALSTVSIESESREGWAR